jgi:hypothetical protein
MRIINEPDPFSLIINEPDPFSLIFSLIDPFSLMRFLQPAPVLSVAFGQ